MRGVQLSGVTKTFSLVVCLLLFWGGGWQMGYADEDKRKDDSKLQKLVDSMQPGWNVGNTLDALGSETSWGNPLITQELIEQIAESGFRSIRLPVTWGHRMSAAPDYTIESVFMERVAEIVDWALEADLKVVLNIHHDSHWIFDMPQKEEETMQRFRAAWVQIADRFKSYDPEMLLLEGINEPRFSEDWSKDEPVYFEMLEKLNVAFHEIVRGSGGNNAKRPLVLSTLTASASDARIAELGKTIEMLNDDQLIATVHYYGFYPFSINLGGHTRFGHEVQADIEQTFDRVHNAFVAKGIPVIVGEYGLLGFDKSVDTIEHAQSLAFFEYMHYYMQQKKLTFMLWDNGQHYDRRAATWRDEQLISLIQTSGAGRSAVVETEEVYLKHDTPITDRTVQIKLHGNELSKIELESDGEGQELVSGVDYTLEGETLTLHSSLLERHYRVENGELAAFRLHFSQGIFWRLVLVGHDTAQPSDAEGTTGAFQIPLAYNGDKLEALEARYENGSFAGPQSWTSYKEFGASFQPDYSNNQLQLTKAFFDEVNDGKVLLRLHFRSGETANYTLQKEGVTIQGYREGGQPPEEEEPVDQTPTDEQGAGAAPNQTTEPSLTPSAGEDTNEDASSKDQATRAMLGMGVAIAALLIAAAAAIYLYRKGKKGKLQA